MKRTVLSIAILITLIGTSQFTLVVKARDVLDYGFRHYPTTLQKIVDTYWALAFLRYDAKSNTTHVNLEQPYFSIPFDFKDPLYRAQLHWYNGDFEETIHIIESEYIEKKKRSEEALYWLAHAYARLGEEKNCLSHLLESSEHVHLAHHIHDSSDHSTDHSHYAAGDSVEKDMNSMCALPLIMVHDQAEYSKKSIEIFKELARRFPKRKYLYTWLVNFYTLTTGKKLEDVEPEFRIDSDFTRFYSYENRKSLIEAHPWLKLSNKSKELGIDTLNAGKGTAVEDFDGDGDLDIIVAGTFTPMKFYANEGGTFVDRSKRSGLERIPSPFLLSTVDINNDGHLDLFVSRWFFPNVLLINDGTGRFIDETRRWQLPTGFDESMPWVPSWADYDNDGDLDLFVAAFSTELPFLKEYRASRLYRNEGQSFLDVTDQVGLGGLHKKNIMRGAWGDVDGDGFQDLFLASANSRGSAIYKNINGQAFEKKYFSPSKSGFAATFLDFDHDGDLDILVPGTIFSVDLATEHTVFETDSMNSSGLGQSWIYLNEGDWNFTAVHPFERHGTQATMGSSYGDINGDGCLDFYFGTGSPEEAYILPNLFFLGKLEGTQCALSLTNISPLLGLGSIQKGHGIVFFDYDNDGDQDMYSNLGGFWPADKWPNQFFVNESELENSWIKIRLRGKKANRYGVGSHIRVVGRTVEGKPLTRYYYMNSKTGFGSAPLLAHVGLANTREILSVDVKWAGQTKWVSYIGKINEMNILEEKE